MTAQQRYAFGFLMAVLAVAGTFFVVQGAREDSYFLGVGVAIFVALIGLLSWNLSNAKKDSAGGAAAINGEPKPASAPPDGHIRFTIVVDSLEPARVAEIWSDLCRPSREVTDTFRALYRNFTVLEGNRFRFMKGDPQATACLLADVLSAASGTSVRTTLEPAADRTPLWS